jgi:xenotropic and polytropic retrovirus receptor 1
VERLRSRDNPDEHGPAVFNVGFLLGLALPFFFEGVVVSQDPSTHQSIPQTAFLLQVWGGIGLVVLFLLLFGINCWVWHNAKINYTFIFEFDTKHHLDYRQYLEEFSFYRIWLTIVTDFICVSWMCFLLVDV